MKQKSTRKAKWSKEEDHQLRKAVNCHGTKSWKLIAGFVPGRSGKQCRERWLGQLCSTLNKSEWSQKEDSILISSQKTHGNKWAVIQHHLPGRSTISIKNRWNWLLRHGDIARAAEKKYSSSGCEDDTDTTPSSPESVRSIKFEMLDAPNSVLFGPDFLKFQEELLAGSVSPARRFGY